MRYCLVACWRLHHSELPQRRPPLPADAPGTPAHRRLPPWGPPWHSICCAWLPARCVLTGGVHQILCVPALGSHHVSGTVTSDDGPALSIAIPMEGVCERQLHASGEHAGLCVLTRHGTALAFDIGEDTASHEAACQRRCSISPAPQRIISSLATIGPQCHPDLFARTARTCRAALLGAETRQTLLVIALHKIPRLLIPSPSPPQRMQTALSSTASIAAHLVSVA